MSEVRNVSVGMASPDDVGERASLLTELIELAGRDTININDGRAWFAIPLSVYLAHVETSALRSAVYAVRSHAWIVARAIARLDPSEVGGLSLRRFSDHLREIVEAPADGRGLLDLAKGGFDDFAAQNLEEAGPVDVRAAEAAGQPDGQLLQGLDVGERFVSVSEVNHPEPLVPRRSTPPP